MSYLFTSESVSEGHPDKVCDQIADAVLDNILAHDAHSKVACEVLATRGQVVLAGEVRSQGYVDLDSITRGVVRSIGYTDAAYGFDAESCGIFSAIHDQSPDINRGVDRSAPEEQGAGDQGLMFGYATNETPNYMPLPIDLAHSMLRTLAQIRKEEPHLMPYLRPDAKSQITLEYTDDHKPLRIDTIVLSTQHDEFLTPKEGETQAAVDEAMRQRIEEDVRTIVIPRLMAQYTPEIQALFAHSYKLYVNPTGKFVVGGPAGDTGVTGRKIIVDTYGGQCSHGGGAFSGKDPSKVDRSAAYAARYIAKNLVAAGVADKIKVQMAYAIGVAQPISIFVDTLHTSHVSQTDGEIAAKIGELFDLRPHAIEKMLSLRNPIYQETASYGHFGREPHRVKKEFKAYHGAPITCEVELFTWEKLDAIERVRKAFALGNA